MLRLKKGLVVGVANDKSIGYGCVKALRGLNSSVVVTYKSDKTKKYIDPILEPLGVYLHKMDATDPESVKTTLENIGELDYIVHSVAFCPDLKSNILDISMLDINKTFDASFSSLINILKYAKIKNGGSVVTMTYIGASRASFNYKIMGPAKAALESLVKYLAIDLGEKSIRVNALSVGPIQTRAASGIEEFDNLLTISTSRSPLKRDLLTDDVGNVCAFLVSDSSKAITGSTIFVDNGFHAVL